MSRHTFPKVWTFLSRRRFLSLLINSFLAVSGDRHGHGQTQRTMDTGHWDHLYRQQRQSWHQGNWTPGMLLLDCMTFCIAGFHSHVITTSQLIPLLSLPAYACTETQQHRSLSRGQCLDSVGSVGWSYCRRQGQYREWRIDKIIWDKNIGFKQMIATDVSTEWPAWQEWYLRTVDHNTPIVAKSLIIWQPDL